MGGLQTCIAMVCRAHQIVSSLTRELQKLMAILQGVDVCPFASGTFKFPWGVSDGWRDFGGGKRWVTRVIMVALLSSINAQLFRGALSVVNEPLTHVIQFCRQMTVHDLNESLEGGNLS